MSVDFLSIGDTQYDTIMVLNPADVEVACQLNEHTCHLELDYASKIPVQEVHTMVAGNAANAAVSASRLHGNTAFWTLLGDDDIAKRQHAALAKEAIATQWIEQLPGAQSNQSTVVSVQGERSILVYHAPRTYQLPTALPAVQWLYLSSMGKGSESIFSDLAKYLRQSGAKLMFQPGTWQLRAGIAPARELLKVTTVICVNKEEAQLYLTAPDEVDPIALCDRLRELGPAIAVITDGINGSYAVSDEGSWHLGIRPEIKKVESTGAGDAYNSALVVALMEGQPLPEAMRWGGLNSESVIGQFGPQAGLLTGDQMQQALTENPTFVATKVG